MESVHARQHEVSEQKRERHFAFAEFKKFLHERLRMDPAWINKHGSALFELANVEEIADFLMENLNVKGKKNRYSKEDALQDAAEILREELLIFLEGPDIALRKQFILAHLDGLQAAKTPDAIYAIVAKHIPSFPDQKLMEITKSIASHFNLSKTTPSSKRKRTEPFTESGLNMTHEELGQKAWEVLDAEPETSDHTVSHNSEILAQSQRAQRMQMESRGVIQARVKDVEDSEEEMTGVKKVFFDPELFHDETTEVVEPTDVRQQTFFSRINPFSRKNKGT